MACAYSPSGTFVACGGLDNKITMYKVVTEEDISKTKKIIACHSQYISCCKFMYSDQQVLKEDI
jgi:guanine nucleotide-binding protein subunit beta-5